MGFRLRFASAYVFLGVTWLHLVSAWQANDELRRASNEGTLRAFRYADRFTTFKIFRRPGALRRRVAPGQSRRSDRIGRPQWGWEINLVCK
jgi:hypothetical protein